MSKYDDLLTRRNIPALMLMDRDYVTSKIINLLMRRGRKLRALKIFVQASVILKNILGFQPFFMFKHVAFGMRQLFKVNTTTIRQTKVIYKPSILRAHNQISYGLNNIMSCMRELRDEEGINTSSALAAVFSNRFISTALSKESIAQSVGADIHTASEAQSQESTSEVHGSVAATETPIL